MITFPRRALRRVLVALAPVAVAVASGTLCAGPAHAYTFPVTVTERATTPPLAPNFLGLALEYKTVPLWMAGPGQATNLPFQGLLRNLAPTGHPSVRIGGESTDRSWWPVRGVRTPLGITYTLGEGWVRAARELAMGSHVRLMLGINMEAGSTLLARVEADELVKHVGIGNIQSLAIGNEPDLYRFEPWYKVAANGQDLIWYSKTGRPVWARPPSWDPAEYVTQFAQFEKAMPNLPLAGPETNSEFYLGAFNSLLSPHSRVRTVTAHVYGLNQCVTDRTSPAFPSVPHLLTEFASRGVDLGIAPEAVLAHKDGASFRIDEMGSITCSGTPGVSNTFSSALWATDALFEAARLGVDGVNLHTWPEQSNGLFDFTYSRHFHRWRAAVHPLYDGAYLFAQAAPTGSHLLATVAGPQSQLRAWATLAPDHRVRVMLINDSETASAVVPLTPPAGYDRSAATIERLTAPSAGALGGIELGGHPFSTTLTGVPPAPKLETVRPRRGVDTITLPSASAALVTLPLGR